MCQALSSSRPLLLALHPTPPISRAPAVAHPCQRPLTFRHRSRHLRLLTLTASLSEPPARLTQFFLHLRHHTAALRFSTHLAARTQPTLMSLLTLSMASLPAALLSTRHLLLSTLFTLRVKATDTVTFPRRPLMLRSSLLDTLLSLPSPRRLLSMTLTRPPLPRLLSTTATLWHTRALRSTATTTQLTPSQARSPYTTTTQPRPLAPSPRPSMLTTLSSRASHRYTAPTLPFLASLHTAMTRSQPPPTRLPPPMRQPTSTSALLVTQPSPPRSLQFRHLVLSQQVAPTMLPQALRLQPSTALKAVVRVLRPSLSLSLARSARPPSLLTRHLPFLPSPPVFPTSLQATLLTHLLSPASLSLLRAQRPRRPPPRSSHLPRFPSRRANTTPHTPASLPPPLP